MPRKTPTDSFGEILGEPKRFVELVRGEALFRRGDPARAIFVVTRGRIRLERTLESGAGVTLAVLRPGDGVAEAALYSDRYHCDATAEVRSRIGVYPKTELLASLRAATSSPDLLVRHFAQQVRRLRALLEVRSIRRAGDRIEAYLDLLSALGETWDGERPKSAVAAELGLTPETLYRTLSELEKNDRIVVSGRQISRKP